MPAASRAARLRAELQELHSIRESGLCDDSDLQLMKSELIKSEFAVTGNERRTDLLVVQCLVLLVAAIRGTPPGGTPPGGALPGRQGGGSVDLNVGSAAYQRLSRRCKQDVADAVVSAGSLAEWERRVTKFAQDLAATKAEPVHIDELEAEVEKAAREFLSPDLQLEGGEIAMSVLRNAIDFGWSSHGSDRQSEGSASGDRAGSGDASDVVGVVSPPPAAEDVVSIGSDAPDVVSVISSDRPPPPPRAPKPPPPKCPPVQASPAKKRRRTSCDAATTPPAADAPAGAGWPQNEWVCASCAAANRNTLECETCGEEPPQGTVAAMQAAAAAVTAGAAAEQAAATDVPRAD
eukprot:TRINITY_DN27071_c0_g1_i1.p1 TRINITY_DN27071_c0_g1~~TRINITY_DN27071_c0_g1_i1.p1  ORF type:complete len:349 (+),score=89.87 TRINITY_DN27071_c0_g1_i1:44-1090(+)